MVFKIKFNWYSMRYFHRALVGWNSRLIHLIFREFSWVSISKISDPPLLMGSWTRCLGGRIFFPSHKKSYILFSISLLIYFGIVYVWPIYQSFESKIWFMISFLPLKESLTLFQIWILLAIFTLILSQFELLETKLSKFMPSTLIEKFDHSRFSGLSYLFL